MSLQPNVIERRLIDRGTIPGVLLDGMVAFQVEAALARGELANYSGR